MSTVHREDTGNQGMGEHTLGHTGEQRAVNGVRSLATLETGAATHWGTCNKSDWATPYCTYRGHGQPAGGDGAESTHTGAVNLLIQRVVNGVDRLVTLQ